VKKEEVVVALCLAHSSHSSSSTRSSATRVCLKQVNEKATRRVELVRDCKGRVKFLECLCITRRRSKLMRGGERKRLHPSSKDHKKQEEEEEVPHGDTCKESGRRQRD